MAHVLQNLKLVENVKKLAAKKNATPGQMALAWLQHQVCMFKMRHLTVYCLCVTCQTR